MSGKREASSAGSRQAEAAASSEVYAPLGGGLGREAARLPRAVAGGAGGGGAAAPLLRALLPTAEEDPRSARRLEREAVQFEGKLRNKVVMLDNPLRQASREVQRERARRESQRRARGKVMPSAERKRRALFRVPREGARYELYEPLHAMWLQYARDVCARELERGAPLDEKLSKADLHGAEISVSRSRCPGYVGIRGIVVQETQRAFRVVTRKNALRTVLKPNTVFRLHGLDGRLVEIYGRNFCLRPPDRASKKLKMRSRTEP